MAAKVFPPLRYALFEASPLPEHPRTEALHRGSFPRPHNLAFLSRLHLKTILSLTPKSPAAYEKEEKEEAEKKTKELEEAGLKPTPRKRRTHELSYVEWARKEDVKIVHIKAGKSKDGSIPFSTATVKQILELIVNAENYPMYMHDLDGSDVLALVGAALRKLQGRTEKDWCAEMSRFLRAPPPESEHITFLKRLFTPSTTSSHHSSTPTEESQLFILIPAPSKRVTWLWPTGMPVAPAAGTKKATGLHVSMRVKVEHEVGAALEAEKEREKEKKEALLSANGSGEKKDKDGLGGVGGGGSTVTTPTIGTTPNFTNSHGGSRSTSRPTTANGPAQTLSPTTIPDPTGIYTITGLGIAGGEEVLRRPEIFKKDSSGNVKLNTAPNSPLRAPRASLDQQVAVVMAEEAGGNESSTEVEGKSEEGEVSDGTGEEEEEEEEEDEEGEEDDLVPISQMIDALDLGL